MPFVPDKPASRFVPDAPPKPVEVPEEEGIFHRAQRYISEGAQGLADNVKDYAHNISANPLTNAAGTADLIGNMVTGAASAPIALARKTFGDERPTKDIREDYTFQPRTDLGKSMVGVAGSALKPVGDAIGLAAKGVSKVTPMNEDTAQAGIETAAAVLPFVKGPKGKAPIKEYNADANPVESLRAAGYKFRPSDANVVDPTVKATVGKAIEKQVGSDELRKSHLAPNQKTSTKLAAQEIGLSESTPRITEKMLADKRAPHLAKYEEVGSTVGKFEPTPELGAELDAISAKTGLDPRTRRVIAKDIDQYRTQNSGPGAVKTISVLRRKASKWLQSDDPKMHDQAIAYREAAGAIEGELERQLGVNSQLIDEFRASREELAKLHNVESALRVGQVDAHQMLKLQEKGAPLTGNLAVIADAARTIPHVTKHPQTVSNISGGGSIPMLSPVLDIASMGVRPLGRRLLGSDLYQNTLGKEGMPPKVSSEPAPKTAPPSAPVEPTPTPGGLPPAASEPTLADRVTTAPSTREGYYTVSVNGKPLTEVKGREAANSLVADLGLEESNVPVKSNGRLPGKSPESASDAEGGHTITTPAGKLQLRKSGQYLRIHDAQVAPEARGKGVGSAMYEKAVKDAEAQGLALSSDTRVSPSAARVYDSLEKKGYTVERNAHEVDPETGDLVSTVSTRPIFVVRSAKKKAD